MRNNDYAGQQLTNIRQRIAEAADRAGRLLDSIRLVGASKQQDAPTVAAFNAAGLTDFGENYLAEAVEKQQMLNNCEIDWHFIGQIQSNKTRLIAENFNWVHSIDRLKYAQRLSAQRWSAQQTSPHPAIGSKPLQVLIQLNVDNEASKAGINLSQAGELCAEIQNLQSLNLRGFMLLPKSRQGFDQQRQPFNAARELLERTNQRFGLAMDTLSMGMSNDLEAAIAEGSTMLRVGTDLFGRRGRG